LENSQDSRFAAYATIREINRLAAEESREAAIRFARSKFIDQPSLALAYKFALMYSRADESRKAVEVLKIIRYMSTFSEDEYALVQKIADLLKDLGEGELALDLYEKLLDTPNLDKQLKISLYEGGAEVAVDRGQSRMASRWTLAAQRLKAPPKKNR
jgi:hypothetical protein